VVTPDDPALKGVPAYTGLGPYSLALIGWRSSGFGYSLDMGSLWARLCPEKPILYRWWARLSSDKRNTEIWISPHHGYPRIHKADALGEAVAARTGKSYRAVRDAINDAVLQQGAPPDFWIP
jgi:hypothetical protein